MFTKSLGSLCLQITDQYNFKDFLMLANDKIRHIIRIYRYHVAHNIGSGYYRRPNLSLTCNSDPDPKSSAPRLSTSLITP